MEENYFDNQLKNILERPPQFFPNPNDLEDMQKRLAASGKPGKRRVPLLFWLLPLTLMPFIFSTVFFFNKHKNLNRKIETIYSEMSDNQVVENKIVKTVYQFDTIHRTLYKDVFIEQKFENSKLAKQIKRFDPFNSLNLKIPRKAQVSAPFSNHFLRNNNQLTDEFWAREFTNSSIKKLLTDRSTKNRNSLKGLQSLALMPFPDFSSSDLKIKLNEIEPQIRDYQTKAIYYFIPKGLNIGGFYGPFAFSNGLGGIRGKNLGIQVDIQFPQNIELQTGIEQLNLEYSTYDIANLPNFPAVNPDDPSDFLNEAKANFSFLQIPIIFKYTFLDNEKWKPNFGIGLVATKPLQQNFKYEFLNSTVGEYKKSLNFSEGNFSAKNWRVTVGLNYQVLKKWQIGVETLYQHSIEKAPGEYFKLNYWSGNLSLKYRFLGS